MYITTNTYNNEIDTPISAAEIESTYMQIYEKRFEIGLTDGYGFTFLKMSDKNNYTWMAKELPALAVDAELVDEFMAVKQESASYVATNFTFQSQKRAWNTQEAAEAYVDFINQLNSPAWSATYDGFDESIQNDGSSLL
jgi:hypothetical protein